jgi:predicted Zn finger-like uncharacterized protein
MKIVCDSCGAKYSIADEKVAGKIFKIRCKKCSSVLEVRGDQSGAHPFADAGATRETSASDATWYIVVDGEQKGPLPPIELSQLFAKGTVGLDSYVWKEGFEDWKVASEVPELAQIFGGSSPAPTAGSESSDDTSAFGTGGDLFSEGGREPTSEIDTNSSMFAGFDDAPTPTSGESSTLAASAAADASSGAGGIGMGGSAVAATAPQKMTGQRNENSVLFSLSNLQQLASRGGSTAEPASPVMNQPQASASAQGAPQASGEGSGLIDIRALAKSTTPGTKTAPAQSVDDLLAIGAGTGGTLGAPLLGPAPLETSEGNRWLWIGGAAIAVIAIVGAGVAARRTTRSKSLRRLRARPRPNRARARKRWRSRRKRPRSPSRRRRSSISSPKSRLPPQHWTSRRRRRRRSSRARASEADPARVNGVREQLRHPGKTLPHSARATTWTRSWMRSSVDRRPGPSRNKRGRPARRTTRAFRTHHRATT